MSDSKTTYIPILQGTDFTICDNATILNGIVTLADINVIGHFGNVVALALCLDMQNGASCFFMPNYNHTKHIGFIVKAIVETLRESDDDGICFSSLKGTPCRVIEKENTIVGIGNFLKDRWLLESKVTKWIKGDDEG